MKKKIRQMRHCAYGMKTCIGKTIADIKYSKGLVAIHFTDGKDPLLLYPREDETFAPFIVSDMRLYPVHHEDLIDALCLWEDEEK